LGLQDQTKNLNPMLETNVGIIYELKSFLKEVANNESLINLFRHSTTDFTRKRKLTFENLSLLIMRLCKKTLSFEIEQFFEKIASPMSCSVSAFSLQRIKLNPSFFYAWNMVLWLNYYHAYGCKVKRWRGFRVLGCDGSNLSLVNKPDLQAYFGGQSNQQSSYVVAKTFYCYDVLNKMILFPKIAPYRDGELRMAYDTIESGVIEKDMLLIFDRYYSSYKMAALLQFKEREIKYVIRVNENMNIAKNFISSKKKSAIVDIYPSRKSIKGLKEYGYIVQTDTPIRVRLIRVKLPSGKMEVLMTNLWEEEGYLSEEFKALYSLRWGVESNIGFQKNILQLESLSGLTPISVMQDFYATVFVSNLHFLLIKHAQQTINDTTTNRKYPMQVNNNKAFGKLREQLITLFISHNPSEILKKLHGYFIREPLPIRKNRSFPRVRINRMLNCKYRTFTNFKPAY
jgi:Transposase DDE domain